MIGTLPRKNTTKSKDQERFIYTVSELNQDVRTLLESGFPLLWLEGEISNLACPSSGHWYFTLKDSKAQVRSAMFKNKNQNTGFTPKQGDLVLVKARISLYEARGEYQLIIEEMEEAGYGALQRAFEVLKKKLEVEGLFNIAVKKTLPQYPKTIGVISSPTGAAIHDVLSVLQRRYPIANVLLYPVQVQGEGSVQQITDAIHQASQDGQCDVILLCRGGGSLEDLWSFNDETVARTIFHCEVPIVSGVGHEIDFTIADFVADQRAPTPSAGAELVTPNKDDLIATLDATTKKLSKAIKEKLFRQSDSLKYFCKQLKHPSQQLIEFSQKVDECELRLHQAFKHNLQYKLLAFQQLQIRLNSENPQHLLENCTQRINFLHQTLLTRIQTVLHTKRNQLAMAGRTLHTVSPLATLSRGYAIVQQRNTNCIVRSYTEVKLEDELKVKLNDGQLICKVKKINPA